MKYGFTLVEILIVVAVMAIISFVAVGLVANSVPRNQLQAETDSLLGMVRRAQARTVSGYANGVWGVHVENGAATLFWGNSFAARDGAYDETRMFPTAIVATGSTDVRFEFRTGVPVVPAAFILTDQATSLTHTINIHVSGSIFSS